MTHPPVRAGALALALSLVVAACGDDANDHALQAQRLADRLAAEPVAATTVAPTSATSPAGGVEPPIPADTTPTVEPTGVVIAITALDNSFRPTAAEARVGDQVVWENRGRNEHDVLSIEGTLEDGTAWGVTVEQFQPGDIFTHTFTEPGEYRYYCTIHGTTDVGMVGTVVVSN